MSDSDSISLRRPGTWPCRARLALGGDGTQLTAQRWEALASLGVRSAVLCLDFQPRGSARITASGPRSDQSPACWISGVSISDRRRPIPPSDVRREDLAIHRISTARIEAHEEAEKEKPGDERPMEF